jgi:hypothetical protein
MPFVLLPPARSLPQGVLVSLVPRAGAEQTSVLKLERCLNLATPTTPEVE